MYFPKLILRVFNSEADRKRGERAMLHVLDALVAIDEDYLRDVPTAPLLYRSKIRYVRQKDGVEDWYDVPSALDEDAVVDCKVLAAWRCAELRVRFGVKAVPIIRRIATKNPSFFLYHVLVRLPNGQVEDPSVVMGMAPPIFATPLAPAAAPAAFRRRHVR